MTFEDFVTLMKESIRDYLPEEYAEAEIEVKEVKKLNSSYPAMIIRREGEELTPSINLLDAFYRSEEGENLLYIMPVVAEAVQVKPEGMKVMALGVYSQVKDHLVIRVSSLEQNREILKDVPYRPVEDLALTVHILVGRDGGSLASAMVTNSLLEQYGISKDQLFEDALKVTDKNLIPQIQPMEFLINRMLGMEQGYEPPASFEEQLESFDLREGMAVLTNRECINGAASLFYPGVMEKIGEQMQCSYFVLPSSVHETILLPDDGHFQLSDLEHMVRDINRSEVAPQDRLSDNVYRYDTKEKVFEIASSHRERMEIGKEPGVENHERSQRQDVGIER